MPRRRLQRQPHNRCACELSVAESSSPSTSSTHLATVRVLPCLSIAKHDEGRWPTPESRQPQSECGCLELHECVCALSGREFMARRGTVVPRNHGRSWAARCAKKRCDPVEILPSSGKMRCLNSETEKTNRHPLKYWSTVQY